MLPRQEDRATTPAEVLVIRRGEDETPVEMPDALATEEPLEIRLELAGAENREQRPVAVTMRTPGSDEELAAGFLFAEGVVREPEDIVGITPMRAKGAGFSGNRVLVRLRPGLEPDLSPLDRHFYTASACGVCGKADLDALLLGKSPDLPPGPRIDAEVLHGLPEALKKAQGVFRSTGGIHAAGLFTPTGDLVDAREDIGRHNALDKLFGKAFLAGRIPLHDRLVLVSGRASYEVLQKTLMAEVPILAAVSAPSSLAVSLARRFDLTLVAFLRDGRFNVYSGGQRLGLPVP